MMKYIVPAIAVIGAALVAFADPIQAFVIAHPAWSGVLAIVTSLVAFYTKSPLTPPKA